MIRILIICLLLGISGCINKNINTLPLPPNQTQLMQDNAVNNLSSWQIYGKIRIYVKNPNTKVLLGRFAWQKGADQYSILKLNSTLNLKQLSIKIYPDNTYNYIENQQILNAKQHKLLEQDLEKFLNLKLIQLTAILNFNHLNYWLLGIPDPKLDYNKISPEAFTQKDWLVKYQKLKQVYVNNKYIFIPHTINLEYLGNKLIDNQIEFKIVVQKFIIT